MFIIQHAFLHTMATPAIPDGYVCVNHGKIIQLGEMSACPSPDKMDTVLDAAGRWVMPGLVDPHCHVGIFGDGIGFEGDDGNESTEPITPHLRALDGIDHMDRGFEDAREAGVTTVVTGPGSANVIGGQFVALKTFGRTVDEMVLREPCAMKVALGENPKMVYHEKHLMPITRMATAALLREHFIKSKAYYLALKAHEENPEDHEKPEYDMKMDVMMPLFQNNLVVKVHAHRADDIATALRIQKEFNVDMTVEHATEAWLMPEVLVEAGIDVILGPLLTNRSKVELRNQNLKAAGILEKAGILPAIMSDHPEVPVQHLRLSAALAVREGLSEEAALKAITIRAAEVCRISDRVGSLQVGKDADLIVLSGHPFHYDTVVDTTMIDGKVVFQRENSGTSAGADA